MKVILKEDVESIGLKGDIIEVSSGYARNFLFRRNLAVPVTKGGLRLAEHIKNEAERKRIREKNEAEELAKKIEEIEVKIESKAGEKGQLYGAVTNQDIAEAIEKILKLKIDKKKILLEENIKSLGDYSIGIKLYTGVEGKVFVKVIEKPEKEKKKEITKKVEKKDATKRENKGEGRGKKYEEEKTKEEKLEMKDEIKIDEEKEEKVEKEEKEEKKE